MSKETILKLDSIEKSFGETKALKKIDLEIKKGEFITLLGPSGCGKTTTLRIIAGLELPDRGKVILDGKDITALEPNKRDMHTVFQNYALFPHMNIYNNIAYSLKILKYPKNEIKEKVSNVLKLVQLEGFEKRKPSEMSGGQQQRVAIARAIVSNPQVVLLDEPLGALDLQLRRQMQFELKTIQQKLGITFIYITHDQEEALNMSDRIVIMNSGNFEQIGTPSQIYDCPRTSFVASFIGQSNIFQGEVLGFEEKDVKVKVGNQSIFVSKCYYGLTNVGDEVNIVVRSENIYISETNTDGRHQYMPAKIVKTHFAGGQLRTILKLENGNEIIATRFGNKSFIKEDASVFVGFRKDEAILTDLEVGGIDKSRKNA